jgi:outer membrane protein TolC
MNFNRLFRPKPPLVVVALLILGTLLGCHPQQPFYFHEDGDLSHYIDQATEIEYPDVEAESLDDVTHAEPPLSLDNPTPREMWELKLQEAVRITLENSKVMRSLSGRFVSQAALRPQTGDAPDALLTRPEAIRTVYDTAIVESSPFGGGLLGVPGVESALAAFDAQFAANLFWNRGNRQQNVGGGDGGQFLDFFVRTFEQDTNNFNASITKTGATGGVFAVRHGTTYDANNNPTRQVYSDWDVTLETSFVQPLLQGSGVQYNRIAGPFNPFTGTGTPQFDGVMLARINADISLAEFEAGVRDLVSDVESSYWELYFAYRNLEAAKAGRASALQTWQKIHALFLEGGRGGELDKEAQAREQYFFFRSQVQQALNDLYRAENRLRYIMGISVSDGRLIRPADEPTTARALFDWYDIHNESLARSVELREQKWRIKQRELELIAARNLLQPRLDAVGLYRWRGLGDDLLNHNPVPRNGGLEGTNAWGELTGGKYQEWQIGLQMQIPIGFRRELSGVRHFQLQLARERARLQDSELEVSHQLGDALRNLEGNYELTQTNFNRRVAAEKQVEAVKAAFEADTVTLDLLLDAQRRRADAEVAYYRSLIDYVRGILLVHYRKGSLLEYNGVYLAEGPWPNKAYFDAERMARQRDASYYLNYGYTRPKVISQGPYLQHGGDAVRAGGEWNEFDSFPGDGPHMPHEGLTPEEVPSPTPDNTPNRLPQMPQAPRELSSIEPNADSVASPRAVVTAKSRNGTTDVAVDFGAEDAADRPVKQARLASPDKTTADRVDDDNYDWGDFGTASANGDDTPRSASRVVIKSSATKSVPKKPTAPKPQSTSTPAASKRSAATASSASPNKLGIAKVAFITAAQAKSEATVSSPSQVEPAIAKSVEPAPTSQSQWRSKSSATNPAASTQPSGGWKSIAK